MTQDAVQEFKVFRNQFDAQYGAALTAVVTVVTKSGTQPVQRQRLLLRPRRRAERDERLRARPSRRSTRRASADRSAGRLCMNRTHFFAAVEHLNVNTHGDRRAAGEQPVRDAGERRLRDAEPRRHADAQVDHRVDDAHALVGRYAYDNQSLGGIKKPTQDRRRPDASAPTPPTTVIHAHSLVVEDNWVLSQQQGEHAALPPAEGLPRHGAEQQRRSASAARRSAGARTASRRSTSRATPRR